MGDADRRGLGPGEALRRAAAHVFVADLDDPRLESGDHHHLIRVLRLRAGETVTACDGDGAWRACRLVGGGRLEPLGPLERVETPAPAVTVAFVPTKGERPEWAVQKLVEVGVDRITLIRSARAVVRWEGDRATRHRARLVEVARQAAMQSRRVRLPVLEGPADFHAVAGRPDAALASADGGAVSLAHPCVLVGPEGGWTDGELTRPLPRVSLGPGVLRTETAAVAAGVLLCALRAGLVGPGPTVPDPA